MQNILYTCLIFFLYEITLIWISQMQNTNYHRHNCRTNSTKEDIKI